MLTIPLLPGSTQQGQRRAVELGMGLEPKSYQNQLWELGVFFVEKRKLRRDFITLYSSLKGVCNRVGVGIFNKATGDRSRGRSLKLFQMRFRLNDTNKFFTEM